MKRLAQDALGNFLKSIHYIRYLLFFLLLFSGINSPANATVENYESKNIPWSGYWWPYNNGGLSTGIDYRGTPAPLEKYEMLVSGGSTSLVSWYEDRFYTPNSPGWYGLCAYWAWASVYENIKFFPSSVNNIVFRVGDKKGLLTLSHLADILEQDYAETPDIFHYWLLHYIKDQQKAFVADLDGSEEIWSYPVFRYQMESRKEADAEHVNLTIYYASDFVHPDYIGTDIKQKNYTYDLYLTDGAITGGAWTGTSISDHPQRLTIPVLAQTDCPYLDYQKVLEIAQSKDDFLEKSGDTVNISPGTYNLILMDEDRYHFTCLPEDILRIQMEKQNGSNQDISFFITDGSEVVVKSGIVTESESLDWIIPETSPPYTIVLTQEDYTDPNIYTLKLDIQRDTTRIVPYIPKNGMWSGFALTNPDDSPVSNVMLTTYTANGRPIQTVFGPKIMVPGERQVFFFKDLPYRHHELSDTSGLKLIAEGNIWLVNLFGNANDRMAGFSQECSVSNSRIIIPDTSASMDFSKTMSGGVINNSFDDMLLELRLYSETGSLVSEIINEPLTSRSLLPLKPSEYPFYNMPTSGWIEVKEAEGNFLTGFQYIKAGTQAESLFALSADSAHKIVPHIPEPGYWETTVTLINPNNVENMVRIHPRQAGEDESGDMIFNMTANEKKVVSLHDSFGKYPGEPLYHSILDINAQLPFAGYYTYSTPEDKADLPLPDENNLHKELVLPHYAGNDGFWWTGAGIFNPGNISLTIKAVPYDRDGQAMEYNSENIYLPPGGYETFMLNTLFAESAISQLSFVKFISDQDIGGFYLYGNMTNEMLSGSNM